MWVQALQNNSRHFRRAQRDPTDYSLVFSRQPESASRTETKDCACPSAYPCTGPAEHFQEFHPIIVSKNRVPALRLLYEPRDAMAVATYRGATMLVYIGWIILAVGVPFFVICIWRFVGDLRRNKHK
jgi:hypothetical protein